MFFIYSVALPDTRACDLCQGHYNMQQDFESRFSNVMDDNSYERKTFHSLANEFAEWKLTAVVLRKFLKA
ncbi:CLUMA_CG007347, isoform A [Clunio marinus]|uniref:CLUMA_CG007347, isoform A n=1 Tax=Clunio marinus TaxID=568069 RepID=A0A1J1I2K2_9DIPT|nr:CLUMA_CG007347, isoform A [Clunio marinus]